MKLFRAAIFYYNQILVVMKDAILSLHISEVQFKIGCV